MKRLLITVAILVICPLALISCAGGAPPGAMPDMTEPAPPPGIERSSPVAPQAIPAPAPEVGYKESGAGDLPSTAEERMIVRNGDMSLVVEDVTDARGEISQLAVRLGGWVVSSQISGEEEEMRGWISIRVPDETFDQAFAELRGLAVRVTSESTSSQDITEEYVDLQARLKNAEATESQYLALLEKAEEMEDILRIYEELSWIRYEIEQIKGRIQYLERTSAMSLISIDLRPATTGAPLVRPGWSASEALKSAIRGLTTFGQGLGTAAIGAAIFSPIWGTILGVLYWRRRRKRKKA